MSTHKVSIIVPVYNAADVLSRCMLSLSAQTFPEIQIIVVDDGSTDESARICDEWEKRDERVHVIHQRNGGVSAARNAGLDYAQGEYVLFVDSDDTLKEGAVSLLYALASSQKADVVIYNYETVIDSHTVGRNSAIGDGGEGALTPDKALCLALSPQGTKGYIWNKMFRRELLEQTPGIRFDSDIHFCEDLLFVVQAEKRARNICYTNEILYRYSSNPGSAVHVMNDKTITLLDAFARMLPQLHGQGKLYCAAQYAVMSMELLYWAYDTHNASLRRRCSATLRQYWKSYVAVEGEYPSKTRLRMGLAHACAPIFCRVWNAIKCVAKH